MLLNEYFNVANVISDMANKYDDVSDLALILRESHTRIIKMAQDKGALVKVASKKNEEKITDKSE